MIRTIIFTLSTIMLGALATGAMAQEAERIPSNCRAQDEAVAPERSERIWQASVGAPLAENTVRIHFINNAMFAIEAGGASVVTDYNGYLGDTLWTPDAITMNEAHTSHSTNNTRDIAYVFGGWGPIGQGIEQDMDLGGMRIRNVLIDIPSEDDHEQEGNSIFIFEAGGLCIGHLGHLHHEPTEEQYAAIGRLDVIMVPVDGGYAVPREVMVPLVQRFRSSIIIPMHWFSRYGLDAFLAEMKEDFAVKETGKPELIVALRRLPRRPTIMVLEPQFLSD
ncbi:MBL fold metallo-hydrolase [Celeribacter persicus]|jgi:hypothetical protein|uniref:L-ascorbate metabolism protein UlaG (Beta-lactamase superfamily) n=1 Tax=Celeribacter persicus TaxID=1651082 RepID=A0A2T5HVZ2_9RHOB|nr:MBL fold metallo-hydrolase [Celeribacter persicus]PTQ75746.1 L-ascorbate metabolism protein UlaG (beta-lactamase superfamily) [Celeribacter persicus]